MDLNKGTDLRWLTVSTVSHNWDEKTACANRPGTGRDWEWPGARAYDVSMGNGNSLRFDGTLHSAGLWHRIRIDPDLVRALVTGTSYGLLVGDGAGNRTVNCRFHTRETRYSPYLEVITEKEDTTRPTLLRKVTLEPAPNWASPKAGAVQLHLKGVPADAFAFVVKINDKLLPRSHITVRSIFLRRQTELRGKSTRRLRWTTLSPRMSNPAGKRHSFDRERKAGPNASSRSRTSH